MALMRILPYTQEEPRNPNRSPAKKFKVGTKGAGRNVQQTPSVSNGQAEIVSDSSAPVYRESAQ